MDDWIKSQQRSAEHILAVVILPLIVLLSYVHISLLIIGFVSFFLITSFRMLWKMILIMLVVGVVLAIIPFLAPIAIIVMIILFIVRIKFVADNWRPFVAGLLVYGSSIPLAARTANLGAHFIIEPIMLAAISCLALHFLLIWLYRYGYSSQTALGIMGSVPLIIISFVLPFLKLHVGFDHGIVHVADSQHVPTDIKAPPTDTTHPGEVYVHSYVRTAPDGDPTNNLSYHGPNAKAPDTSHLVQVHGYYRTLPDGDLTNNLSYHDHALDASINDSTGHALVQTNSGNEIDLGKATLIKINNKITKEDLIVRLIKVVDTISKKSRQETEDAIVRTKVDVSNGERS